MEKKEKGEFKDFTDAHDKTYKNKVVFLRKSKAGNHLYAFDNDGAFASAVNGSIIMNVSEIEALIEGKFSSIKVSVMEEEEDERPKSG